MPTPSEIQTCVDNLDSSSQPIDFTILAAETSQANTGISFSVATVEDLPTYSDVGLGQIFFVESIGVPVISTRSGWSGLDGRVLPGDTGPQNALFTFGINSVGQLSDGTQTSRCSPVREICFASNWCSISASKAFFLTGIKSSGQLWAWGSNNCGQLGDGTFIDKCSPVREICSATNWCQVSAGGFHIAATKTSGELWAWGRGLYGMLGDGTTTTRCSPVREICSATDWCQASAGYFHTAALKTSGQLWAWGNGRCGRLGDGTLICRQSPVREFCSATDWNQVSAGFVSTSAIKTSGELWSWGDNSQGHLGDGTLTRRCSPVREFYSASDWCSVSLGSQHGTAIKTTGELWAWGINNYGRLGDGTTTRRCSPVREFCSATNWCQVDAGLFHTAAVKTSGELWTWGNNQCGGLGDGTVTSRCSPVREISYATDWCQVSGGRCFNGAIRVIT